MRYKELLDSYKSLMEENAILKQKVADLETPAVKNTVKGQLRKLIHNFNVAMLFSNKEDVIEFANQHIERAFETPDRNFINKQLSKLVTTEVYKKMTGNTGNGETITPGSYELEITTKKGSAKHLMICASPYYNENEVYSGAFLIVCDITTQKQLEKQLIKAKEEIEKADHLKKTFLTNITHEIRTPLNAIIGFSTLLNSDDFSREEKNDYTNIITQSGESLLRIVNNIIDFSRLEAGEVKLLKSELHLPGFFTNLYNTFKSRAEEKGINFILETNEAFPDLIIHTDKERLKQVFLILLDNACKFTEEGAIVFGYSIAGETAKCFVKDTGIGIKAQYHKEIFDHFRQVDESLRRRTGGSGLGLAIAQKLVRLMGGTITVKSETGSGSTFSFSLDIPPQSPSLPAKQKTFTKLESRLIQSLHVLIVDDVYYNYLFLNKLFANLNIPVYRAENGKQAIRVFKENPQINLILMDIRMPEMNGIDATNEIRKFDKKVKIIALTAYNLDIEKEEALAMGFNEYMSKPVDFPILFEKINALFTPR